MEPIHCGESEGSSAAEQHQEHTPVDGYCSNRRLSEIPLHYRQSEQSEASNKQNARRSTVSYSKKQVKRSKRHSGSEFIFGDATQWNRLRVTTRRILRNVITDTVLGFVVVFDIWMTALGIDYRAAGEDLPLWMNIAGYLCMTVYCVELIAHAIVDIKRLYSDRWVLLDVVFVIAGFVEIVVDVFGIDLGSVGIMRILRVMRIARLLKIFRKFRFLKELRKLMEMASSCAKTLLWSFLFCFLVMTSFSMVSVEFMGPLVRDLADEGVLEFCGTSCTESMKSVTSANLYLFKTVIAGDGWGHLAWPMIERHPWTAFMFIGSLLVLVFGVLNLIVAVVVDTAAEQRQRDTTAIAEQLEAETESDMSTLEKMFRKIDEDESGGLTLNELMVGAQEIPEFQDRLRVMDIDMDDLEQFFHMLDLDGGGEIEQDEFTGALSRWMLYDPKTSSRFVKYNVQSMLHTQAAHHTELRNTLDELMKRFDQLPVPVQKEVPGGTGHEIDEPEFKEADLSFADVQAATRAATDNGVRHIIQSLEPLEQLLRRASEIFKTAEKNLDDVAIQRIDCLLTESFHRAQDLLEKSKECAPPGPDSLPQRSCEQILELRRPTKAALLHQNDAAFASDSQSAECHHV